ncbi:MAG: hypothetical protein LKH74_05770 [Levilactobacillus sp.]|uniref:Uncharacterized protein n=1 Tax=Levilactobacillus suantsaiihabitans TaxID=2487722 RepID=A0A4Z0JBE6_9LACO|nr:MULTISPECIES: hypothetical protein [Levilactobacillus]MCI1553417.1 hypothetical protein [Levilactobacillus sp.]MCI1597806.1 hypothetical protein [Levilactobacillus sp.]MCI1605586.1 hypothetical protein [Levilactobacillus sp.]TGD19745.1 hypothetical protein EGT51_02610 [Levilactobacillus suantsaiihabitans]
MKRLLLAGAIDSASQLLIQQLSHNPELDLTVYTSSAVTLPATVTALTEEVLDEGGLSAAMLDQDLVVALVPTIHLAQTAVTLATAVRAAGNPQLIIGKTDDIDDLPLAERQARQTLLAAGVAFDLVEGLGSVDSLLGVAPTETQVFGPDEVGPLERFAG